MQERSVRAAGADEATLGSSSSSGGGGGERRCGGLAGMS